MAIGWMTAIKLVPWTEVVGHAPNVIAAARKLWGGGTASAPPAQEAPSPAPVVAPGEEAAALAALAARVAHVEGLLAGLDGKLAASNAVVKELAEQNAQLIRRIESNRVKTVRLAVGLGITFALAFFALLAAYLR